MKTTLTEMKAGQTGTVVLIKGGGEMRHQLERLGIREGKIINKISSVFSRGPVMISVDRCQLAIGYGKARRVIVEVQNDA